MRRVVRRAKRHKSGEESCEVDGGSRKRLARSVVSRRPLVKLAVKRALDLLDMRPLLMKPQAQSPNSLFSPF